MKRTVSLSSKKKRFLHLNELAEDMKKMLPTWIIIVAIIILGVCLFDGICVFRLITGIPCPGCGITRSLLLLITGHPVLSFKMYPLLIAYMIAVPVFVFEKYYHEADVRISKLPITTWYMIAVCFFTIIAYIIRMYIYFPNQEPYIYYSHNLFSIIRKMILK